jgi:hypothetical protein
LTSSLYRAYFFLILFVSFLRESNPSSWKELGPSYETFVRSRPVYRTIERELDDASINALLPLQQNRGELGTDEVAEFVAGRNGNILSAMTLLKSDFFSNLQKMSLPERVDGAPNFRRVKLALDGTAAPRTPSTASAATPGFSFTSAGGATTTEGVEEAGPMVYGSGMPTVDGLRRMFERIGAKETSVFWHSLREEPVLFIGGRPHVSLTPFFLLLPLLTFPFLSSSLLPSLLSPLAGSPTIRSAVGERHHDRRVCLRRRSYGSGVEEGRSSRIEANGREGVVARRGRGGRGLHHHGNVGGNQPGGVRSCLFLPFSSFLWSFFRRPCSSSPPSCTRTDFHTLVLYNSILTPREVFDLMKAEGFKVDYDRLPGSSPYPPSPSVPSP